MGDVLSFPSTTARGLAYLDRTIRDLLTERGADDELIDFAAAELTRVYRQVSEGESYRLDVRLPDGLDEGQRDALYLEINAGLEALRKENHGLVLDLVAQLVLARVSLFQRNRG